MTAPTPAKAAPRRRSRAKAGSHRLTWEGDLTVLTAADHKAELVSALESHDAVELDLSGVAEIDTAGLQVLLLGKREARQLGKPLSFARPSQAVADVLALTHLGADLERVR